MTEPGPTKRLYPRQSRDTRLEHQEGRVVLTDAEGTLLLALNDSAAALWELCDGKTTIEEMVMVICEVSSVPPGRARNDVERSIAMFERAGLLSFAPAATGEHRQK